MIQDESKKAQKNLNEAPTHAQEDEVLQVVETSQIAEVKTMETTMVTMQDSEVKNSSGGSSVQEDQVLQTLQANQILENQIEENSNTGYVGETPAESKEGL